MFIHRQLKTTLSLVLFILFIQNTFAQDWPQWRGANRDGAVKGFTAPKAWPDQLKQIWKAPVGVGHSSPLVIGARVYLHSRQAENEVVAAYDLNTGKTISPLLSGDLLFGMSHKNKGQFFCLDAASGETLWTGDPRQAENAAIRDQTQAIKLDPRFAGACSDRCAIRQLKGDLDGDSADCSRAIELDARNATAYFNLAAI
jgi:outer membrane protein assembly factor BamB